MVETEQKMVKDSDLDLRGERGGNYKITHVPSPRDQDGYVTKHGSGKPVLDMSHLRRNQAFKSSLECRTAE